MEAISKSNTLVSLSLASNELEAGPKKDPLAPAKFAAGWF